MWELEEKEEGEMRVSGFGNRALLPHSYNPLHGKLRMMGTPHTSRNAYAASFFGFIN